MDLEARYDFELERVSNWITSNRYSKVLIQSAPGLLPYLPKIAKELANSTKSEVLIDGRGRYGACDIPHSLVGAEAVVHFGHTGFVPAGYPILYVPAICKLEIDDYIPRVIELLIGKNKVGLCASVQHIHTLSGLKRELESKGKKVMIGPPGKRAQFPGQVVGCDYLCAMRLDSEVDSHLIVAGGEFHSIGLALSVSKPVIHLNPYSGDAKWVEKSVADKINRIRGYAGYQLMSSKKVAVVEGLVSGQRTPGVAKSVRELLNRKLPGATVDIIQAENFSDDFFLGLKELGYDIAVTAACTRFVTDDYDRSPLPIFEAREVHRFFYDALNMSRGVFILQ